MKDEEGRTDGDCCCRRAKLVALPHRTIIIKAAGHADDKSESLPNDSRWPGPQSVQDNSKEDYLCGVPYRVDVPCLLVYYSIARDKNED